MTSRQPRRLLILVAPLLLVLVACGGAVPGQGGTDDPAGRVRGVMSALAAKDMTKLTEFACAEKKDDIVNQFTGGVANLGEGIDPQQVLDAVTINTSNVTVGEATVNGDTASVKLGGSMSISIDPVKLRPVIKAALEAKGLPADDATIDLAMQAMPQIADQQVPMDNETVDLIKENGAWVICE